MSVAYHVTPAAAGAAVVVVCRHAHLVVEQQTRVCVRDR